MNQCVCGLKILESLVIELYAAESTTPIAPKILPKIFLVARDMSKKLVGTLSCWLSCLSCAHPKTQLTKDLPLNKSSVERLALAALSIQHACFSVLQAEISSVSAKWLDDTEWIETFDVYSDSFTSFNSPIATLAMDCLGRLTTSWRSNASSVSKRVEKFVQ